MFFLVASFSSFLENLPDVFLSTFLFLLSKLCGLQMLRYERNEKSDCFLSKTWVILCRIRKSVWLLRLFICPPTGQKSLFEIKCFSLAHFSVFDFAYDSEICWIWIFIEIRFFMRIFHFDGGKNWRLIPWLQKIWNKNFFFQYPEIEKIFKSLFKSNANIIHSLNDLGSLFTLNNVYLASIFFQMNIFFFFALRYKGEKLKVQVLFCFIFCLSIINFWH